MFIDGYQVLNWLGQEVHVYKGNNLGLVSAKGVEPYRALQTIDNLKIDGKTMECVVNAGYFEMANRLIYGQHYGVEQTDINDFAPKQNDWYVCWQEIKNGPIKYDLSSNYWLSKNDVQWAVSPAAVMLHDGQDLELYSLACGKGKITTANTQTLLMQFADNSTALVVVKGKLKFISM